MMKNRVKTRYLVAFAFGIMLWFFVDTINGAADLDVVDAFSGSTTQIATIGVFLFGVVAFFWADRNRNIFAPSIASGNYGLAIPLLVAVSIGIHGLGEGAAFGSLASQTTSNNLLDAFAGPTGGGVGVVIAYLLHKALEPMIIGACYCWYCKAQRESVTKRFRDILLLSLVFVVPSLAGAGSGYFVTFNVLYFFALGTGSSIYAAVRLAGPLFDNTQAAGSRESVKIALLLALGLLSLYFAALFHSG